MAGRKIRNEEDARVCLEASRAAAGLSQTEWARENGIDGRSLFAWGKNLGGGAKARRGKPNKPKQERGRLVELIPGAIPGGSRYLVRCGELAVEIDEHFDEGTLTRLLRVMAGIELSAKRRRWYRRQSAAGKKLRGGIDSGDHP